MKNQKNASDFWRWKTWKPNFVIFDSSALQNFYKTYKDDLWVIFICKYIGLNVEAGIQILNGF